MNFLGKVKDFFKKDNKTICCAHCGSENIEYHHQLMHCKDCNIGDDRVDVIETCYLCGSNFKLNTKYYRANDKRKLLCHNCTEESRELDRIDNNEDFFDLYKNCKICGERYKVSNKSSDNGICCSCKEFKHPFYKGLGPCCQNCGHQHFKYDDGLITCKNCNMCSDRVYHVNMCCKCGKIIATDRKHYRALGISTEEICVDCLEMRNCKVCGKEYKVYNKSYDNGFCCSCRLEDIKRDYKDCKDYEKIEMKEIDKCRDCGKEFSPKNNNDNICDNCKN